MENVSQETQKEETQSKTEDKVEESPKEKTIVDEAKEEREKLEKVRDELKAENDRTEILKANQALGGATNAGTTGEKVKEDPIEFSKKMQAGEIPMDQFLKTKNE